MQQLATDPPSSHITLNLRYQEKHRYCRLAPGVLNFPILKPNISPSFYRHPFHPLPLQPSSFLPLYNLIYPLAC